MAWHGLGSIFRDVTQSAIQKTEKKSINCISLKLKMFSKKQLREWKVTDWEEKIKSQIAQKAGDKNI